MDTTDRRVQLVLRALRRCPDYSMGELWELELGKHAEGYGRPGLFNYGWLERAMPKLRKAGFIVKGKAHRMSLTSAGEGAILPLLGG